MRLTRCKNEESFDDESDENDNASEGDEDEEEDFEQDYEIDMTGMWVRCTVYKHPDIVLEMDIDLNGRYLSMKADLENIFCRKASLIDLARKLETDLLIYEVAPNEFRMCFKDEVLGGQVLSMPSSYRSVSPDLNAIQSMQEFGDTEHGDSMIGSSRDQRAT